MRKKKGVGEHETDSIGRIERFQSTGGWRSETIEELKRVRR